MEETIRLLQQRIDKKANWIAANESKYAKEWNIAWVNIVREHTLDKRMMGVIVQVRRERNAARKREG